MYDDFGMYTDKGNNEVGKIVKGYQRYAHMALGTEETGRSWQA